jgi:tetratricopeptide (TPR) repeat protein
MLFDLRGRGRRRAVRLIYTGLALLMGVGLIGFGIGGGFGGGGLLNAASNEGGGGGPSVSDKAKKYEALTKREPNNIAAWEKLAEARILEAGGEAYLTATGLTSQGREKFNAASQAWERYLALNPPHPSLKLAKEVLRLYEENALKKPEKAVEALQIIVAADPQSASYYSQLALYAYQAKNKRVGDLASQKAVALAPEDQRTRIKQELQQLSETGGTRVYTTVTNGKTFQLKKTPNGQFAGTEVKPKSSKKTSTTGITTTKK